MLLLENVRASSLEPTNPASLGVCRLEVADEADASIGVLEIDPLATSLSEYVAVGEDSAGGNDDELESETAPL